MSWVHFQYLRGKGRARHSSPCTARKAERPALHAAFGQCTEALSMRRALKGCASPDIRDLHPGRLALVQQDIAQLQAVVGHPLPLQEFGGDHDLLEEPPAPAPRGLSRMSGEGPEGQLSVLSRSRGLQVGRVRHLASTSWSGQHLRTWFSRFPPGRYSMTIPSSELVRTTLRKSIRLGWYRNLCCMISSSTS